SFLLLRPAPPRSPLFPYTTLFRSWKARTSASSVAAQSFVAVGPEASAGGVVAANRQPSAAATEATQAGIDRIIVLRHGDAVIPLDRKSTRLNSSHVSISYAVFCLK